MIHHKKSIDLRRMSENDKRNFAVSITDDIREAQGLAMARTPGAELRLYCSVALWEFLCEYAFDRIFERHETKLDERRICGIETVITELPFAAWHLASLGERDHAEMLMYYGMQNAECKMQNVEEGEE